MSDLERDELDALVETEHEAQHEQLDAIAEDAEEETYTEACLSFPQLELKVKRQNAVLLEYTNAQGVRKATKFVGVWAQAIQHEMDHLEGILFIDYLSKLKRFLQ